MMMMTATDHHRITTIVVGRTSSVVSLSLLVRRLAGSCGSPVPRQPFLFGSAAAGGLDREQQNYYYYYTRRKDSTAARTSCARASLSLSSQTPVTVYSLL